MQQQFLSLSQSVARLSQRRGDWPDIRSALHDILNNLQLYGVRAGDEGTGHVPVPIEALVREPRLDRLHAVQVAGHCLKGLEHFGDDDRADWLLGDGDVLHDGRGLVAWRQLCVRSIDLEPLLPVQGPVYEASLIKPARQEEQRSPPPIRIPMPVAKSKRLPCAAPLRRAPVRQMPAAPAPCRMRALPAVSAAPDPEKPPRRARTKSGLIAEWLIINCPEGRQPDQKQLKERARKELSFKFSDRTFDNAMKQARQLVAPDAKLRKAHLRNFA